jgi:hypothetical protein
METLYELRVQIEELDDGGDYRYMGTSPDLPNKWKGQLAGCQDLFIVSVIRRIRFWAICSQS